MNYTKLNILGKDVVIAERPSNFGKPYQELFDSTDLSGYDVFLAEMNGNDSPLVKSNEDFYTERKNAWFAELFRDTIENGSLGQVGKRLHVKYTTHSGLPNQLVQEVWAPKNGYWVPTEDGIFVPNTLVPFETVQDKKEAVKRLEKVNVDPKYVSYFYRNDNYEDGLRFVVRDFGPDDVGIGRFCVDAGWLPGGSGDGSVGARLKPL